MLKTSVRLQKLLLEEHHQQTTVKMFKYFLVAALLGVSLAASSDDADAQITKLSQEINADGSYAYEYAQSNGVAAQEQGVGGHHASGSVQHISPEGETIQLQYTADETGFHPVGSHLPVAPAIPEYIRRAIEYIQAHPSAEELADQKVRAAQI